MALVPDNIRNLVPYSAGRRIEEVLRFHRPPRVVKLASNENPLGPSPRALAAAQEALLGVNRYPDPTAYDLRRALAERFSVRLENVIAGSGSEGIMSGIMRTFLLRDDEIISAQNTFVGFQVLARASGRTVHWVPMKDHRYDLQAMADAINERTKLIYVSNPDNPTGSYVTVAEFDAFMARVPERVLVILDEAYFEFAAHLPDYPDSMHYRYDNVITLRTFSKAHGLAGLRVGYGFAHDELIHNLHKVKLPFEPAGPAQQAALAALADTDHLEKSVELVRREIPFLNQGLSELGLKVLPSAANFVTVELADAGAAETLAERLVRRGVIIRPLKAFGWPTCVRITAGLHDENEFLISELRQVLA